MSASSYQRACAAGREDEAFDEACIWDTLTLEQCVALTGYRPQQCHSVLSDSERADLQLKQAQVHARNKYTRGDLSMDDVRRVVEALS